ncbi:MAG: T9SS type A sorting domain-containing protein [Ignavibacterium sp.]|nr:MAG: T9SS type A sorting domain-containing protein [Ignavibacterium sp.]
MLLKNLSIIFFISSIGFTQQDYKPWVKFEREGNAKTLQLSKIQYPGDSQIDVTYYKLDLTITYNPNNLIGAVTVNAKVNTLPIANFFLDLQDNMNVDSILLNEAGTTFNHINNKVTIDLDSTYSQNEAFSVVIYYHGVPGTSGLGSFKFDTHGNGEPIISTLSQPYGASEWWPCKDIPEDKADSADIWITVDQSMIPVSNGVIQEIIVNGDGTHTYKWKEKYSIAQYLISMAITNYFQYDTYYHYSPTDSMIITHYNYPERFDDNRQALLDETATMMEVFSNYYGEYPFLDERYGHAEFNFGGAMEHQTCSSMGFYGQGVIAHELAHQWFGDMITCKDWHHIWLNEGFATYSEGVYYEAIGGQSAYDQFILNEMSFAKQAQGTIYVQDISNIGEIFNGYRSYAKGGIVLHMLRGVVGDSAFFDILRAYAADPELVYNVATTEDFQRVAERVYRQSLDYFFEEWIYGENYPRYNVSWYRTPVSDSTYQIDLDITQEINSNPSFFTMPIQIKVNTELNDTTITLFNNVQSQNFEFDVLGNPRSIVFDPANWILKDVLGNPGTEIFPVPIEYSLDQNFPNPFNSSTIIRIQLPQDEFVTLKIFNILGEELATRVNENMEAGRHEVVLNAASLGGLSSGVYFYRIVAGSFVDTKKMILLK